MQQANCPWETGATDELTNDAMGRDIYQAKFIIDGKFITEQCQ